jgi:acyl-CoA synthetase (AMP-forming)/AMP-acid ligase II
MAIETIPAALHDAVRRFPANDALVDDDRSLTYAEVGEATEELARALITSGVGVVDRVSIWGPNGVDWALLALAVYRAGAVLVPLNTRFKAAEAGHVLRAANVRFLFAAGDFLGIDYVRLLDDEPGLDRLAEIVTLPGPSSAGATPWDEFRARASDGCGYRSVLVAYREQVLQGDDVADIVFTSGTTGVPKGAMLTHAASIRTYLSWTDGIGLRSTDRFLVVFPYFQTSGLKAGILACVRRGAANVPQAVFDVADVARRIALHDITVVPGAPTMFQDMIGAARESGLNLASLRIAVTGGATTPVEVIRQMHDELRLETIVTAYGLTETTGAVSMNRHDDPLGQIATTVGRPLPGVEVRIVDDGGRDVAVGEPGEILVRGFNVMRGYLDDAAATAATIDADGWLRTGDVGTHDSGGVLRITDRKKDMVIVGGFNVYPAEVENVLVGHPAVAQVAVVGVPHERLGEVCAAFVIPRAGRVVDADEVVAWCRERMANYKAPRHVTTVDAFPLNPMGKVQKFRLRELARDIESPPTTERA